MSKPDRKYLEQHGNKWRVVVPVPRHLQKRLGCTKLKQTLKTDSLTVANSLKWLVVASLKKKLRVAGKGTPKDPLLEEALALRKAVELYTAHDESTMAPEDVVQMKAEEIRGEPIDTCPQTGEAIYHPDREAQADYYYGVASGTMTPIQALLERWHAAEVNRKERTKGDDRRALGYLEAWCKDNNVMPTVETITRKQAGRFISDLPGRQRITNRTVNKYLSSLSAYWAWMKKRDSVQENVWREQFLPKEKRAPEDKERAFTDDEVRRLLEGTPTRKTLGPLMRIAALTGARIDPIVSLKVRDCANGLFRFKPQKKEPEERYVPIHSALVAMIEELKKGKEPDEDLLPGYPVLPAGDQRERSMPAVKAFGIYKRSLGIDERRPGRKRSLNNFHSFRRWFITKAEQAGIPGSTISTVVGHKREGMTLGLYSEGPLMEQLRACVEAVKLP